MTVINTNINSLVSQNALVRNNRALSGSMEQLSTGKRINSASDDAAGLAISSRMTAQIRGLDQAVRNANDGISLLQTAEGAMIEITNMLQRMRELSVQAGNDTYTGDDRSSLNLEYGQLMQEINRIAQNTQWNGMDIMNNSAEFGTGGTILNPEIAGSELRNIKLQVGANSAQTINAQFKNFTFDNDPTVVPASTDVFSGTARINNTDVLSAANANNAMDRLDAAILKVDDERALYGAIMNRLTYAADNLTNVSQNTSASRSRILDTDYAKASSELARTQIIQQAATAILAQANQSQQSVLKLLQG